MSLLHSEFLFSCPPKDDVRFVLPPITCLYYILSFLFSCSPKDDVRFVLPPITCLYYIMSFLFSCSPKDDVRFVLLKLHVFTTFWVSCFYARLKTVFGASFVQLHVYYILSFLFSCSPKDDVRFVLPPIWVVRGLFFINVVCIYFNIAWWSSHLTVKLLVSVVQQLLFLPVPEFTAGLLLDSCFSTFSFPCGVYIKIIFLSSHCIVYLPRFTVSDYPFGIYKLFLPSFRSLFVIDWLIIAQLPASSVAAMFRSRSRTTK
jgi:hypothetical protein